MQNRSVIAINFACLSIAAQGLAMLCIWFDFQEASLDISFLPNQNLHSFQSCNTVQIDWELGLREGLGNYKTFLFSYCNLCSLPPLWNYIEVTHCMSRSSLEAFSKEIWKSFMNTLIPIKNLISSVLILCTFSNFCIKIIMFTYLQLMNKGKFDNS